MPGSQGQGRGRSNSLPAAVVDYLRAWLLHPDHIHHPYPTEQEKAKMIADTGIDMKRLNNWFVNSRIRIWKPRYEAMMKQHNLQPGQKAPSAVVAPAAQTPQRTAKEQSHQVTIQTTFEAKKTTTVPRRVSLVPPSPPPSKMLHQISDASLHSSDSSLSSSSSLDSGNQPSSVSVTSVTVKRPNTVVTFTSPSPRPQKRPRIISEGEELSSPSSLTLSIRYSQEENVEVWKQACLRSPRLDDQSLPTLDEAACLFGFSVVA